MLEKEKLKLKEQTADPVLKVGDDSESIEHEPKSIESSSLAKANDASGAERTVATANSINSEATDQTEQTPAPDKPMLQAAGLPEELCIGLPEQELLGLAMHPNTPESDWLKACAELNRREQLPPNAKRESSKKHKLAYAFVAGSIAILAAAAAWIHLTPLNSNNTSSTASSAPAATTTKLPIKPTPYTLSASRYHKIMLQRRLQVAVANCIADSEWSDAEAAKYLQVDEQTIHDLMRASRRLSMDQLTEMLVILRKNPDSLNNTPKELEYSRLPQPSKQESKDTITYLTRAINLGNDSVSVLRERAEAHMDLKEYDLAIADYTRCIKQDPEALQERALAYRDSGNLPAALKDLNEYMSLSKNNDAYQNRALVYVAMDDYKNALKDCSESIARMKVQRPGPYWNRAMVEEKLGMYKEALADCQKVLEADPTYASATAKSVELKKKL